MLTVYRVALRIDEDVGIVGHLADRNSVYQIIVNSVPGQVQDR